MFTLNLQPYTIIITIFNHSFLACYRLQINYFDESMKKIWDTSHPFKSWNFFRTSAIQGDFDIAILSNNNLIYFYL